VPVAPGWTASRPTGHVAPDPAHVVTRRAQPSHRGRSLCRRRDHLDHVPRGLLAHLGFGEEAVVEDPAPDPWQLAGLAAVVTEDRAAAGVDDLGDDHRQLVAGLGVQGLPRFVHDQQRRPHQ
jgi:hypothetical protein